VKHAHNLNTKLNCKEKQPVHWSRQHSSISVIHTCFNKLHRSDKRGKRENIEDSSPHRDPKRSRSSSSGSSSESPSHDRSTLDVRERTLPLSVADDASGFKRSTADNSGERIRSVRQGEEEWRNSQIDPRDQVDLWDQVDGWDQVGKGLERKNEGHPYETSVGENSHERIFQDESRLPWRWYRVIKFAYKNQRTGQIIRCRRKINEKCKTSLKHRSDSQREATIS